MYVNCEVWPGTFDSEVYVIVGNVSAVVDKRNVRLDQPYPTNGTHVVGSVLVYVVDEQPGRALVELPGQAVVGGLRTWVPRNTLAAA
jgi:hypothetical protein